MSIVIIAGPLCLLTRGRIDVLATELFTAGPTPGTSAPGVHHKAALSLETACKNIVAGGVLESPSFTPGALFGVGGHGL